MKLLSEIIIINFKLVRLLPRAHAHGVIIARTFHMILPWYIYMYIYYVHVHGIDIILRSIISMYMVNAGNDHFQANYVKEKSQSKERANATKMADIHCSSYFYREDALIQICACIG